MEAGGSKDRPHNVRHGNLVQWKSRNHRDTVTTNLRELIHYCLQNPPYTYQWAEKTVPVAEGSSENKYREYRRNYKIVSQDNEITEAETEAVQIILTGIDNDIYSTVDAYRNCISQQYSRNRGKAIVTSSAPTYDPEPPTVTQDEEMSKEKEIDKLMLLILSQEVGVQLNAEQADWKDDTDDESDDQ
ncbi:hypothetical protein Tco_1200907 [Tanacetum coccineum]